MGTALPPLRDTRAADAVRGITKGIENFFQMRQIAEERNSREARAKLLVSLFNQELGAQIEDREQPTNLLAGTPQDQGVGLSAQERLAESQARQAQQQQNLELQAIIEEANLDFGEGLGLVKTILAQRMALDKRRIAATQDAAKDKAFADLAGIVGTDGKASALARATLADPNLDDAQKNIALKEAFQGLQGQKGFDLIKVFDAQGRSRQLKVPKGKSLDEALADRPDLVKAGFRLVEPVTVGDELKTFQVKRDELVAIGVPFDIATKTAAGVFKVVGGESGVIGVVDPTKPPGEQVVYSVTDLISTTRARELDKGIATIQVARLHLKQAKIEDVGIMNFLKAVPGGLAAQFEFTKDVMEAMGLSAEEISEAQSARSTLFGPLIPFAQSLVRSAGSGDARATTKQLAIAEEVLRLTQLSTTSEGAEQSRQRLLRLMDVIEDELTAQRLSRRAGTSVTRWKKIIDPDDPTKIKIVPDDEFN